jgi:hypothetical protein
MILMFLAQIFNKPIQLTDLGISSDCLNLNSPASVFIANLPAIVVVFAVISLMMVAYARHDKSVRVKKLMWILVSVCVVLSLITVMMKMMGTDFVWDRGEFFSTVVAFCL